MKKLILVLLCWPIIGFGQLSGYELQFNNISQDYVEITNASSLISNQNSFTISGWVYPKSNTNHAGIMGFRNNLDADFYILQLQNTNNIEARFRNSNGVNFDIVAMNSLDFNQWQHLALSYDGSHIRLFKNSLLIDSISANGIITQSNSHLRFGMLDWQGTGFYMDGKLDEIRLWNTALSSYDINYWMCRSINLNHPLYSNLLANWKMDEGSGTVIYDYINPGNQLLSGVLYGSTNWQPNSNCTNVIMQNICDSININLTGVNLNSSPSLIHFNQSALFLSNYWFGYCGFILLNNNGDTIAFENINTAGNVFGIGPGLIESRMLDIVQNITTPFYGQLHLIEGYFAGNPITQCVFPFNILNIESWNCGPIGCYDPGSGNGQYFSLDSCEAACIINNINEQSENIKPKLILNILGKEVRAIKRSPLLFINDDGSVKKIVIE